MTRWRVLALIAIATLVPALTVAVVLADLPNRARRTLLDSLGSEWVVLALGLVVLVTGIGWVAWSTWRSEQRHDVRQAGDIMIIANVNPAHRLAGATAVERAVNVLAERHANAEHRLTEQLASAHAELTRERDALFAVLSGLDVPVGVVDDLGRLLLVNPAARQILVSGTRAPVAAGRSIFGVFDADDFSPLLTRAIAGERVSATVRNTPIRMARITGPDEPAMVLVIGEPGEEPTGPVVGLSVDLSRPSRPAPTREEWLATPLDAIVFTVLDCETTGLHAAAGDRLIALGAVRVDAGMVRAEDTFDALVNPGVRIPESSTRFHGISDELVRDAPSGPEVLTEFAAWAADSVLVGHHLAFDLGFLAPPASQAGITLEPLSLDTMLLSAVLDADPDARHGLDGVCERFGVEVIGRHTALGDALATAEVLVRMIPLLSERGIITLGQARDAMAATGLASRLATVDA
ncbi:MAG: exonuclease domain-containing protein [Candidatus Nanopelagicales bacterium]|jgi:DNA polymerase III epsilon subunit family exonuclease|nr:exonuclease domain-containing protein [Candidatus Nanopelagicales bacterium]